MGCLPGDNPRSAPLAWLGAGGSLLTLTEMPFLWHSHRDTTGTSPGVGQLRMAQDELCQALPCSASPAEPPCQPCTGAEGIRTCTAPLELHCPAGEADLHPQLGAQHGAAPAHPGSDGLSSLAPSCPCCLPHLPPPSLGALLAAARSTAGRGPVPAAPSPAPALPGEWRLCSCRGSAGESLTRTCPMLL